MSGGGPTGFSVALGAFFAVVLIFWEDAYRYILLFQAMEAERFAARLSESAQVFVMSRSRLSEELLEEALDPTGIGTIGKDGTDSQDLTSIITTLGAAVPREFWFELDVDVLKNHTSHVCIKIVPKDKPERFILYSSAPSNNYGWEGNFFRKMYYDEHNAAYPGKWCQSDGRVSPDDLG